MKVENQLIERIIIDADSREELGKAAVYLSEHGYAQTYAGPNLRANSPTETLHKSEFIMIGERPVDNTGRAWKILTGRVDSEVPPPPPPQTKPGWTRG